MKLKTTKSSQLLFSMSQAALVVISALSLLAIGTPAKADLVQNGNFLSTTLSSPGGYFCAAGATCISNVADWTSVCNAGGCGNGSTVLSLLFPGTNGTAFNGGIGLDGTVADPPDGDNFVAADGDPLYSAPFSQTITGLSAGVTYLLSFDQAAAQQAGSGGATTEQWQVSLGSETLDSTLMNNPSGGFTPWNQQTLNFTATSSTEALTFLALGTPSGVPPVVLLSDVSLVAVATPEPSSVLLTLSTFALLGISAIRRQRRKSA